MISSSSVINRNLDQIQSKLIAIIGDEDACVGFLLGGIGERNRSHDPELNYLVVHSNTTTEEIQKCFLSFLRRKDIDIILIQQTIADRIRQTIDGHQRTIPVILEIPSKSQPYDTNKDSIFKHVKGLYRELY
ncbi:hypothetical protein RDWZM_002407 [Blomia tropicalis]|uniref:V-type proton ATPase subunit F n=1 Tax=Blomia tropicalis TaxID=40697 RepID=A0A9Q0MGB0_BLOTA|nr:hypothetical protein RDWZM_002407 [Blomia tropicalis]